MESKVTFKIVWDIDPEKTSGHILRKIKCGDAEDIPLPLYMAILKAMMQVENDLNGKAEPPVESPAPQPRIVVPAVSKEETSTPPRRKQ